jgi:hypothetical protein
MVTAGSTRHAAQANTASRVLFFGGIRLSGPFTAAPETQGIPPALYSSAFWAFALAFPAAFLAPPPAARAANAASSLARVAFRA